MTPLDHYEVIGQTLFYGNMEIADLMDLTRRASASIPPSRIRQWRITAHNLVVHPLYGDAVTIATDGVHVLLDIRDGHTVEVACTSCRGPITGWPIAPEDWDWDRNCRRVHVYKRKPPQPPAIIPVCKWLDRYWTKHDKLTTIEHMAYAALADRSTDPHTFEIILGQLRESQQQSDEAKVDQRHQRTLKMDQRIAELLSDL